MPLGENPTSSETAETPKEPWDFQKFKDAHDAIVREHGGYLFAMGRDETEEKFRERYMTNPFTNTMAEFAACVLDGDQGEGADDLAAKYKTN
jgi:hypothetical protein